MKFKIATASVLAAALLSAPVANAAPSDANGVANNVVGGALGTVTGTDPTLIIDALNGLQGFLSKLGFGGKDRGNGNGAALQKATLDNVGKTLKKPVVGGVSP